MNGENPGWEDIAKEWIIGFLAIPELAISLPFFWLSGYVINFLVWQTHSEFKKYKAIHGSLLFKLAMGILPGAIVLLAYHLIVYRKMPITPDELALSVMPSALILASFTFIAVVWRVFRK